MQFHSLLRSLLHLLIFEAAVFTQCTNYPFLSPAHDITYLDPFLGPQTGSLYITDYKMYFKATPSEDKPVSHMLGKLEGGARYGCPTTPM